MSHKKKIKNIEEIKILVKNLKEGGKKIVTTNGAFDVFHVGHLRSLSESKSLGDVLIVGVNSDSSVKRYKSKNRPINSEIERAEVLAGLECVDFVFIFDEINPTEFLKKIKPDIHTNSMDYGERCVESGVLKEIGAELYLLKKYSDKSSTNIINKILNCRGEN